MTVSADEVEHVVELMKEIGVGDTKDARMASAIGIIAEGYQLPRTPKPEEIFSRAFLPPKAELNILWSPSN